MNWDDDDYPRPSQQSEEPLGPKLPNNERMPAPERQTVTFRDIFDGCVRTGYVLRTIVSNEHTNAHLGKLPIVTLYLVAFESARRKDDLAVIDPSLIVRPPKPRP
jgi:hypothetical protein